YACDNDVADHQVVTIEFEGGVTATLTMSAFTPVGRRRTRIMGTRGFLEGDGTRLTITDFVTGEVESLDLVDTRADAEDGHGGGDFGVIGAFVDAVSADGTPGRGLYWCRDGHQRVGTVIGVRGKTPPSASDTADRAGRDRARRRSHCGFYCCLRESQRTDCRDQNSHYVCDCKSGGRRHEFIANKARRLHKAPRCPNSRPFG